MIETLLIAVYVFPVISAANLAARDRRLSPFLAILTFGLVNISGVWRLCGVAVRRLSFAEAPAFDPNKPVHRTAAFLLIIISLFLVTISLDRELMSEIEELPASLAEATTELVSASALHLAAAILGVGWLARRRLPEAVSRLCLRMPTPREAGISIAVGVGLWLMMMAAVAVWERSVPAEVFQQQTEFSRLYFQVFTESLGGALLLAVLPAVSEEIFYRGALQPIFGLFLSSLFFTATHLQYALTPASLILFVVSLGFAWLRLRFHTSAAIIAHAVFNFLPYLAGT